MMVRACRPYLSARLCASLQIDGERNLFLLEARVGSLKGRSPIPLQCEACRAVPERGADLPKTAGAGGLARAPRLIPKWGQHRRGSDPNLRDPGSRHLVRT